VPLTRDALRHKRNNGERVGNIQFGYHLCADRRHVEPDPGEQAVLAEIQNLRQSGQTLRGITAALNHGSCGPAVALPGGLSRSPES
jgi:hypothetical protein